MMAAGVVYPLMMRELFARVGFAWAVRVMGGVMLGTLLVGLAVLKPYVEKKERRVVIFEAKFLKDSSYTLFILGMYHS